MSEFYFKLNEFKNVCCVFKSDSDYSLNMPPVEILSLTQVEEGDDLEARCWVPQSRYIQKIVQPVDSDLGRIKNILNENYSKIIKFFFLGDGVKKEVIVNGFYFNEASQEVQLIKKTPFHNAGYMANKKEQVVGSRAMYELSHILAEFNKGWEPNWSDNNLRWSIVTFANSLTVIAQNDIRQFLTFRTMEEAQIFLEEHRDLIRDMSNASLC
jgi:hypothetical protein